MRSTDSKSLTSQWSVINAKQRAGTVSCYVECSEMAITCKGKVIMNFDMTVTLFLAFHGIHSGANRQLTCTFKQRWNTTPGWDSVFEQPNTFDLSDFTFGLRQGLPNAFPPDSVSCLLGYLWQVLSINIPYQTSFTLRKFSFAADPMFGLRHITKILNRSLSSFFLYRDSKMYWNIRSDPMINKKGVLRPQQRSKQSRYENRAIHQLSQSCRALWFLGGPGLL